MSTRADNASSFAVICKFELSKGLIMSSSVVSSFFHHVFKNGVFFAIKKSIVYLRMSSRRSHPIYRDGSAYIRKQCSLRSYYNLPSFSMEDGLSFGTYAGQSHLMLVRPGDFIESTVMQFGCWEPHIVAIIDRFLSNAQSTLCVDIGSNVGATVLPLATSHPNCNFVCFEAHLAIHHRASVNVGLNGLRNVTLENRAVSDTTGFVKFYAQVGGGNMGLSSVKLNPDIHDFKEVQISSISIDDFFADCIQRISVLKIDVQGAELLVLKGSKKTIARFKPAIVFEFEDQYFPDTDDRMRTKNEISLLFMELGYTMFAIIGDDFNFYPKILSLSSFNGEILALSTC